ncbi:hypothetical protein AB7142_23335, partial [Escherichia coli]
MFLASLLRRIAFSYYDYKAYNFNIEKTEFVVIHIPDQIGDAMAIWICPYISRHLLSLNPLLACCRRYSR